MNKENCCHNWVFSLANDTHTSDRCEKCGLFRFAQRSIPQQRADKICKIYKDKGYGWVVEGLAEANEPTWIYKTLEEIGEMVK